MSELYILIGFSALALSNIISCAAIFILRKRINTFMGNSQAGDMEDVLASYYDRVEDVSDKCDKILVESKVIKQQLSFAIQKIGVKRYNPFPDMGGDLSYVIALLDAENDGFVLNTIFSRDGSRTYLKPVNDGKSTHTLSPEELMAISEAVGE